MRVGVRPRRVRGGTRGTSARRCAGHVIRRRAAHRRRRQRRRSRTPRSSSKATHSRGSARKGERQPPAGARRVDLTGKTVMPALIDGHNHIGLVNEKDGSNSKANYTPREPDRSAAALRLLRRRRGDEHGARGRSGAGLRAARRGDPERGALPHGRARASPATPMRGPPGEPRLGIPYGARNEPRRDAITCGNCTRAACTSSRSGWTIAMATVPKLQPERLSRDHRRGARQRHGSAGALEPDVGAGRCEGSAARPASTDSCTSFATATWTTSTSRS